MSSNEHKSTFGFKRSSFYEVRGILCDKSVSKATCNPRPVKMVFTFVLKRFEKLSLRLFSVAIHSPPIWVGVNKKCSGLG
jgi:hypothetical protein